MYLHCTKALLDKLKPNHISLTPLEECDDHANGLYSWHAHFILINRRKTIVFMNDLTRYSVVLYRPKPKDFMNLETLFLEGIRAAFREEGFSEEIIEVYLENCGQICYAKTAGRKMTGYLNKACDAVSIYREHLCEDTLVQKKISLFTGKYLMNYGNDEYARPAEIMARELCTMAGLSPDHWQEIRNVEVYQLMIRLVLEGHDIWRRITIPSRVTFWRLHTVIQEIFDWQGYHCHEFYLLKDFNGALERPLYSYQRKLVITDSEDPEAQTFLDPDRYEIREDDAVLLSDVFRENQTCFYCYDFGDGWRHMITLEKVIPDGKDERIKLIDRCGKRPPEDVGGESGFDEYLRVISDKADPEYQEMIDWAEGLKERDRTIEEINNTPVLRRNI